MNTKKNYVLEIWRIVYPVIVYLGLSLVVGIAFSIVLTTQLMMTVDLSSMSPTEVTEFVLNKYMEKALIISMISGVLSLCLTVPLFFLDKKKAKREGGLKKYGSVKIVDMLLIFILGIFACISINYLISISGLINIFPGYEQLAEMIYESSFFTQLLFTVLIAPVVEEFLFRGIIYKRLTNWCKPLVAGIISSAIFGAIHLNMIQFIYAFIIGMMLAYLYEKYKKIWVPILFHAAANGCSILTTKYNVFSSLEATTEGTALIVVISTLLMLVMLFVLIKREPVKECMEITKQDFNEEIM